MSQEDGAAFVNAISCRREFGESFGREHSDRREHSQRMDAVPRYFSLSCPLSPMAEAPLPTPCPPQRRLQCPCPCLEHQAGLRFYSQPCCRDQKGLRVRFSSFVVSRTNQRLKLFQQVQRAKKSCHRVTRFPETTANGIRPSYASICSSTSGTAFNCGSPSK
jgi:hypothetical protein